MQQNLKEKRSRSHFYKVLDIQEADFSSRHDDIKFLQSIVQRMTLTAWRTGWVGKRDKLLGFGAVRELAGITGGRKKRTGNESPDAFGVSAFFNPAWRQYFFAFVGVFQEPGSLQCGVNLVEFLMAYQSKLQRKPLWIKQSTPQQRGPSPSLLHWERESPKGGHWGSNTCV